MAVLASSSGTSLPGLRSLITRRTTPSRLFDFDVQIGY